jgi:hypothetical protein
MRNVRGGFSLFKPDSTQTAFLKRNRAGCQVVMQRWAVLAKSSVAIQNPARMNSLEAERQELARFRELVLADRALHDRLRAVPHPQDFFALAIQLGVERGCVFSAAVLQTALNEQRRAWLERWI